MSLISTVIFWNLGVLGNVRIGSIYGDFPLFCFRAHAMICIWFFVASFAFMVLTSSVYECLCSSRPCWRRSICVSPASSASANFFNRSLWTLSSLPFSSFISSSISCLIPAIAFLYSSLFGGISFIAFFKFGIVFFSISLIFFSRFSFAFSYISERFSIGWPWCSPVTQLIQTKTWHRLHCRKTTWLWCRLQLRDDTADAIWTRGTTSWSLVAATFLWYFLHPSHNVCLHTVQ